MASHGYGQGGVGSVGHISNKETVGATSVSQRMWADWFMLSEVLSLDAP